MASMAVDAWPASLIGMPTVDSYGMATGKSFVGYNTSDGHTEFGPDIADAQSGAALAFQMSAGQFREFETFYAWTLGQGTSWFSMQLRIGLGMFNVDCHITDAGYTANYFQGNDTWDVGFNVEFGYGRIVKEASLPWLLNGGAGVWKLVGGTAGAWSTNT
jgi:hypothetical protein